MQYLGGKSRIARNIAEVINNEICRRKVKVGKGTIHANEQIFDGGGVYFVSLFCGSCVIESLIETENKICNDKHEYLIELFKGLQNGYELPEQITQEQYKQIRTNKDNDKALTGFVGFGCSFGGKWFGGYARNNSGTNYAKQSKNSLLKTMKGLQNAKFTCGDYKDVEIPKNAVVYCDIPYQGTTGYSTSKDFNYDEFWNYARELSKEHIVFISEENAPEDFVCVWSKEVKRVLDSNKANIKPRIEKLFIHKCNLKGE